MKWIKPGATDMSALPDAAVSARGHRALVVSTFHISSTRDVWFKVVTGLQMNGVDVVPFDIFPRMHLFSFLKSKVERSKQKLPEDWDPTTLAYEACLGAAIYNNCDTVIIVSPQFWPNEFSYMMRRVGIKVIAIFTECPYEDVIHTPVTASSFDYSFVSDKASVGLFESFCDHVEYLSHCYLPSLHYATEDERDENIVFVGTGYLSRITFLKQVTWQTLPRLDMYGWYPKEWLRYDTPLRRCVRDKETKTMPETAALYRRSAASFSLHREARYVGTTETIMEGEAYSLGPRNWELAACGCFQISDFRQELVDVFKDSVPIFDTPDQFTRLMRRAFDDPAWRIELAQQQREAALPYSCDNVMRPVAQAIAA